MRDKFRVPFLTVKALRAISEQLEYPMDYFQLLFMFKLHKFREFFLSAPRQIGKTHLAVFALMLYGLMGFRGIYTAHRGKTSKEVFNRLLEVFEKPHLAVLVERIEKLDSGGVVYFKSGGFVFITVRSKDVGVGLTFDFIIWDEAQKVSQEMTEGLSPILQTSKLNLELFIGTPPTREDFERYGDSPFIRKKKEHLASKDKNKVNYMEFSAAEEYSSDLKVDAAVLKKANPAIAAGRVPEWEKRFKRNVANMSHEAFCRQYLGVWVIPEDVENRDLALESTVVSKAFTSLNSSNVYFMCSIAFSSDYSKAYVSMFDGKVIEVARVIDLPFGSIDGIIDFVRGEMRFVLKFFIEDSHQAKAILREFRNNKKIELVSKVQLSGGVNRFINRLNVGSVKVFDNSPVLKLAMSSWWLSFDERYSVSIPGAADGNHLGVIKSLAIGSVSDDDLSKLKRMNVSALKRIRERHEEVSGE